MSKYRNSVVIDKSSVVCKTICEAAAKSMNLNMISEHKMGGVYQEPRRALFASKPVKIKITMLKESADVTKVVLEGDSDGAGLLQSMRVKKQVALLTNIINEVIREDDRECSVLSNVEKAAVASY